MKRKNRMVVKFTSSHQDKSKSGWSIDEIIDGPKFEMFNGKMEKLYKVRWSESYERATNLPPDLIEIYNQREKKQITILGPLVDNKSINGTSNGTETARQTRTNVPLTMSKFAVEIGGEISLMTYTEVKSLYKNELFEYFEERARIEDRD